MISSTSWTPDEDFGMLFNSFLRIEKKLDEISEKENINIKKILFIITGRGPQKELYMNKIKETNFKYFNIKSIWLNSDDYPKILGSADLGVCLHYSSSGFDLPMKVVDMFAAQLPVCAVYYPTIKELVEENKNGFLFNDENDLTDLLTNIIKEYSKNENKKEDGDNNSHKLVYEFSQNLKEFADYDWVTQWNDKVKDTILSIVLRDKNNKIK